MKTLKYYLGIYKSYVETSFASDSQFRLNFYLLIMMDIIFYLTNIFGVSFIYDHVELISGWTRFQFLFFIAFMLTIDNLHMAILSESFWTLARDIKTGQLDYIILRPVNTVFSIFFRYTRSSSIFYSPVVWGVLFWLGYKVELSLLSWILLPLLVLLGFLLTALLEFIISSSMFIMVEGLGINFLRMQMQNLSRWPDFIFSEVPRRIFTMAIPALIIGSCPVKFLFDNNQWLLVGYLLLWNIIALMVLIFIWPRAMKFYESASS